MATRKMITPRPPEEPIINRFMVRGIIVQTIAITAATLIAFFLGGGALKGSSDETRILSETFAFVTLSLSELFRAYTAQHQPTFGAPLRSLPSRPVPPLIHRAGVRVSRPFGVRLRVPMVMKQLPGSRCSGS